MIASSIWMLIGSITLVRAWSATTFRHTSLSQFQRASSATTTRLHLSTLATSIDNATDATMATPVYPKEMTEDERYLFDLNGYLIIRGVLTPEEIKEANKAIDTHAHEMVERGEGALRNAVEGTKFYGQGPGRKDLGRVLEWGEESRVFKSILAHPRLAPVFHGILGKGYRMDHLPMVLAQDKGSEGFQLHGGTIDCSSGEYNPYLAYTCQHGTIRSALLGCNVILEDHNPGDGGFCIVPGSHKSNFRMPKGMVDGEKYEEFIIQPATKAGDVILFSEGTVHGAKAWTSDRQRRTCLYRFSPSTNVYGRSYFGHEGGGWPTKMYEGMTDAQRAVLEPPYANRLDRPLIQEDGSTEMSSRNARKKQHDQDVFGTKYF
jgi:ectoine hydroxylase-related dioxygenase (phytanoyl-CoA dioxygenase family)